MPVRGHRLVITLIVLAVVGFGASVAVLLWMNSAGSVPTTTASPALTPSLGRAADGNDFHPATPAANPAAQKAGPPDPVAEKTAADAASRAADAAAVLATSGATPGR